FQVVNGVAQSIASLEQARALNEDDGAPASEQKPCCHSDRLPLPADTDQGEPGLCPERGLPRAQLAVRDPDDVRDAALFQDRDHGRAVEHGNLTLDREWVSGLQTPTTLLM